MLKQDKKDFQENFLLEQFVQNFATLCWNMFEKKWKSEVCKEFFALVHWWETNQEVILK